MFGDLTREQKGLVDWFFIRLMNIYGNRFRTQFASDAQIVAAKVEWGDMVCQHGREKLHAKLHRAKEGAHLDPELKWPNIGYILSLPTGPSPNGMNSQAYSPHTPQLPDHSALARAKASGTSALSKMRNLLANTTTECRKNTQDRRKRTCDGRRSTDSPLQDRLGDAQAENPTQYAASEAIKPSLRNYGGFW